MTLRLTHEDICRLIKDGELEVLWRDATVLRYTICSHPECLKLFWASRQGGSRKNPGRGRYCSDACFDENSRRLNAERQKRYRLNNPEKWAKIHRRAELRHREKSRKALR